MRANQVRWMVAGLAAVGSLAAGGTVWLLSGNDPVAKPAARTVERLGGDGVTAKGTVEPVSTRSLSFSLSGTVTAVTVQPGDVVVAGQVLARIDQADAKQAVADARAALDEATAALAAAWASASASASASPGPSASCRAPTSMALRSMAPTSTALASTAPTPTAQTSAPTAQPSASAATLSSRPSPAAPSASSAVAVGCTAGGSGGDGATGVGSQRGGGTDAILSAQQQVNNDTAALARAERQLAGTVITAPVPGKVLDVAVKIGDTARSNVITVGVVSTMVVEASFSEADVVSLAIGQPATITLPGRSGESYPAKITQIAETATVSDNLVTYAVILVFDRVPDGILVGQSANVTVTA